jgi:hypothetical protein
MGKDIVKGFLDPTTFKPSEHEDIREKLIKKTTEAFAANARIFSPSNLCNPNFLREALQAYIKAVVESGDMEGIENIPDQGKVIIAPNHPFGIADLSFVTDCILSRIDRSWSIVSNSLPITRYVKNWEQIKAISEHIISVIRTGDGSYGQVANKKEVIARAVQFLNNTKNPMLIIAPEGGDSTYRNGISPPHEGFHSIAAKAQAVIVPVLITGEANLEEVMFTIKGKILSAFNPEKTFEGTAKRWLKSLNDNL